jgi:hypothetical protein
LRAGEWLAPALLVAVFVLIALFVNPLREALTEDDSWLYAQTAQRFANEGTYRLHSYATANMPVQIYWSAALSKSLRFLARDLAPVDSGAVVPRPACLLRSAARSRADAARAVGLALVYLCNPYALIFSYSFMTDVQFLSWMMVALFFYARGLRSNCIWRVLGGSLAAAAAIGTRQFGVMLIGGMVLCWACDPDRRQKVWIYGAGLVLPLALRYGKAPRTSPTRRGCSRLCSSGRQTFGARGRHAYWERRSGVRSSFSSTPRC